MSAAQNSELVAEFVSLYRKILDWTNDDPQSIVQLARDDEEFARLCDRLDWVYFLLHLSEREARGGYITPVPAGFIAAWRDYEERLASPLANFFFEKLGMDIGEAEPTPENFDHDAESAKNEGETLTFLIDYAQEQVDAGWRDENLLDAFDDASRVWKRLTNEVGFDLEGALRRASKFPLLLVPTTIARQHGTGEQFSLYQLWSEARTCFIFGSPLGTMALARSILERVLRRKLKKEGDLNDLIHALSRDNRRVARDDLQRIRIVGNAILHFSQPAEKDRVDPLWKRREETVKTAMLNQESEAARALSILRNLIEKAL